MNKLLEAKLLNFLKDEYENLKGNKDDKETKLEKMIDIYHFEQIIENFDELEPIIAEYINKKAKKNKFER